MPMFRVGVWSLVGYAVGLNAKNALEHYVQW